MRTSSRAGGAGLREAGLALPRAGGRNSGELSHRVAAARGHGFAEARRDRADPQRRRRRRARRDRRRAPHRRDDLRHRQRGKHAFLTRARRARSHRLPHDRLVGRGRPADRRERACRSSSIRSAARTGRRATGPCARREARDVRRLRRNGVEAARAAPAGAGRARHADLPSGGADEHETDLSSA